MRTDGFTFYKLNVKNWDKEAIKQIISHEGGYKTV